MDDAQKIIEQLTKLLNERDMLKVRARWDDLSDLPDESEILSNRMQAAIDRLTHSSHTYARQADACRGERAHIKLPKLYGIVAALRDDMRDGLFESLTELVHADTNRDYLDMAQTLLDGNYKDAAAVIAGSSLEVHLRALCVKFGIDVNVNGKPKKAEVMNADLKKAGAYELLQQKQVTAWLDVRNSAAHGGYAKYDADDVRSLIDGVRTFTFKYPA